MLNPRTVCLALCLTSLISCLAQYKGPLSNSHKNPNPQGFPDFGYMVSETEYNAKYSKHPVFRIKPTTQALSHRKINYQNFLKLTLKKNQRNT